MSAQSASEFFDPEKLGRFTRNLAFLPPQEVAASKILYLSNAISAYESERTSGLWVLIISGCASFLLFPLVFFIPALFIYLSNMRKLRQQIINTLEYWKEDLRENHAILRERIGVTKSESPQAKLADS